MSKPDSPAEQHRQAVTGPRPGPGRPRGSASDDGTPSTVTGQDLSHDSGFSGQARGPRPPPGRWSRRHVRWPGPRPSCGARAAGGPGSRRRPCQVDNPSQLLPAVTVGRACIVSHSLLQKYQVNSDSDCLRPGPRPLASGWPGNGWSK